jgi:hypothetical protein
MVGAIGWLVSSLRPKLVPTLGKHTAIWNNLAVEVRHLLKKPGILEPFRCLDCRRPGASNAVVSVLSIGPICGALGC